MIHTKKSSLFLSLFLLLISSNLALATEVKVTLDRNTININESVQLTFTAADTPDNGPDFSPLEKDFKIVSKNYISNSTWGTGQDSKSIQWVLSLTAKRTGKLLIPPIPFGKDNSQAITLVVTKSKAVSSHNYADLFMEVEVSPKSPYVQSQVVYTLRLFSKVQLSQAKLSELTLADALVEKLGDIKKYTVNRDDVEYAVNELNYAIFPQKSGVITIAPLVLTADIINSSKPRFNSFFRRQMTKTERISSNSVTLDVRPVPDTFKGKFWIPANQIVLKEKWSGDVEQMKVGEPLTRTLTLLAIGNTVSQLPELHNKKDIGDLKTYPDQPVLKQQKKDGMIIALREEKIAYIPSKSGSYILPALEFPWFNTQTQTMEIARIPEKILTTIATTAPQKNVQAFKAPVATKATVPASPAEPIVHVVENNFWLWVSILLALFWFLSMLYFFIQYKKRQKQKQLEVLAANKEIQLQELRHREISKRLKQACEENNAPTAKNTLLIWGKMNFDSNTLAITASYCEARLRDEILRLNLNLYSNKSEPWQSEILFQTFSENNARKKLAKKMDDALEPLYKV